MVDDKYEFTGYTADDIAPQLTALMIKHKIISTYKINNGKQQQCSRTISVLARISVQ